jgi:hypothetical protein
MPSPRVATKLHLPRPRPDLVARPRLAARLDRGARAKLTLVSAPTGFGKTSLVAQWLSSRTAQDRTVVWIALDPADDQPAAFWAQVLTALQAAALPAIGKSILPLLESGQPPTEGVLAVVVNELSALPDGLDLVLDEQLKRESDRARTARCAVDAHATSPRRGQRRCGLQAVGWVRKRAVHSQIELSFGAEEVGFEPTDPCRSHDFQSHRGRLRASGSVHSRRSSG